MSRVGRGLRCRVEFKVQHSTLFTQHYVEYIYTHVGGKIQGSRGDSGRERSSQNLGLHHTNPHTNTLVIQSRKVGIKSGETVHKERQILKRQTHEMSRKLETNTNVSHSIIQQ